MHKMHKQIKKMRQEKAYQMAVAKTILVGAFYMYSSYEAHYRRRVTKATQKDPYVIDNANWNYPELYKDSTGFTLNLPDFKIVLSHEEFINIMKAREAEYNARGKKKKTPWKARPHKCDACGTTVMIGTNHLTYTERCKCHQGTLICVDRPKVTKFEKEMQELREFLPHSVEVKFANVTRLERTILLDGKAHRAECVISWNNEHGNSYGNTFRITGDIFDSKGNWVASGAIGDELEKHFPPIEGMAKYHGLDAYDYNFASNNIFRVKEYSDGLESVLHDINWKEGEENITVENNLLNKEWLQKRLRDVVLPEFKRRIEQLGYVY